MTDYVLAGTGSRRLQTAPASVKWAAADAVGDRLAEVREAVGGRLVVMSGMAEGFDSCVARAALRAGVRLWCAVPTRSYGPHYWGRRSVTGRDRLVEFEAVLAAAWRVTFVMEDVHRTNGLYLDGVHANYVRNTWMVGGDPDLFAGADEFVAWDPRPGSGTAHCVEAARKAGKPVRALSDRVEALTLS